MKMVLNRATTGSDGFILSREGFKELIKLGWTVAPLPDKDEEFEDIDVKIFDVDGEYDFVEPDLRSIKLRSDPDLIKVVEKLGPKANTDLSFLCVVDVPDNLDFEIVEINGLEWVIERENLWPKVIETPESLES